MRLRCERRSQDAGGDQTGFAESVRADLDPPDRCQKIEGDGSEQMFAQ